MLFDDMIRLKEEGMQDAATAWEALSTNTTLTPMSIYKAACATKCSEMITQITLSDRTHYQLHQQEVMKIIEQFFEATVLIGGQEGIDDRLGHQAGDELDRLFPIEEQTFYDTANFARRMHALDSIALLAAQRFGKEQELQGVIKTMQHSFMELILVDFAKDSSGENETY